MKKRVFMFAMVVAMLLSFTASVWAGTPVSFSLTKAVAKYKTRHIEETTAGSDFNIKIQAHVAMSSTAATTMGDDYVSEADKVKFEFDLGSDADSFEGTPSITNTTVALTKDNTDVIPFTTKFTGKIKKDATVTISMSLMNGDEKVGLAKTATIVFSTTEADDLDIRFVTDEPNEDVPTVTPTKVAEEADPDKDDKWDGIDPTYPTSGTMGGNGNDKPSIKTSKLVFTGDDYKGDGSDKVLKSGSPAEFEIEIQGPGPLIDVYVSKKDAKKLWPLECDPKLGGEEPEEDIRLTRENIKKWHIPFRVTVESLDTGASQDKNTKHTLTIAYNGAQVAYKGFPITVSAANDKTADSKGNQKPVTKTYKIDIVSGRQVPQWVTATGKIGDDLAKKNAQEISVALASGGTLGGVIYTVSADGPYYITSKGDKIGMSADVTQPVLNIFGEVVSPGYVKVHGTFDNGDKGTKGGTKETKVAFTLDAVGSVKKTTFKPTVIGKVSPYFDPKNLVSGDTSYAGMDNSDREYDGYYKVKTAEAGRVPSVKFAAKGSKTITYSITEGGDELKQYGLSFDVKKGQIVQLVKNGAKVPTTATSDDGDYAPVEITVVADNGTGHTATATALVGVTGAKAKPYLGKDSNNKELKSLVIPTTAANGTLFSIGSMVGKKEATSKDMSVNVQFRPENKAKGDKETPDSDALKDLGLVFVPSSALGNSKDIYRNSGVLKVSGDLKATKGTKVNFILSNLGNEQKGSVTIAIVDPTPVISVDLSQGVKSSDVVLSTEKQTVYLVLKEGKPSNNSAKITWAIKDKLSGSEKSNITVKLTADTNDSSKATLDVTAKAGKINGAVTDSLTITAQNSESKLISEKFTITLHSGDAYAIANVTSAGGKSGGKGKDGTIGETTALEDDIVTDEELTAELGEGEVTMGAERTVGMLTDAQAKVLDDGRFVIAAILPEISATADGQYGFEVDLAENVKAGAKLYWFAFPKDAPASEDDTIIDFFEINGTDTEVVPEDRIVVIYPWMRAGVTYGPVIAVKADDADSGEAVTEGELEGAAEKGTDK